MALSHLLNRLQELYGKPEPLPTTDPFELILWENVGYLADDAHRARAFTTLRDQVGLAPSAVLAAPEETLVEVARIGGIHPELRASRLRDIAAIVDADYGGNLAANLPSDTKKALKVLQRFPSIGKPGAEKILLFTGRLAVLALDSNGLRALNRLGYGTEERNYSAAYKSAQEATRVEIRSDIPWLIRAHQLLRTHGQNICRRTMPQCEACPLTAACRYYRQVSRGEA